MTSKKHKKRAPAAARKRSIVSSRVGWLLSVGLLLVAALVVLILKGFWSLEPAQTHDASESSSKSRPSSDPATFALTIANAATAPGPAPQGMVWIRGGEFSRSEETRLNSSH